MLQSMQLNKLTGINTMEPTQALQILEALRLAATMKGQEHDAARTAILALADLVRSHETLTEDYNHLQKLTVEAAARKKELELVEDPEIPLDDMPEAPQNRKYKAGKKQ